jgi:transcriptional regulator with XRE-family HTH domain
MPSFGITLSPSKRAAGRFINSVRRKLQSALSEETEKRGLTQTDIARKIGVHRSVINRERRGRKDITLGRVAELASAMGRRIVIEFPERVSADGDEKEICGILDLVERTSSSKESSTASQPPSEQSPPAVPES